MFEVRVPVTQYRTFCVDAEDESDAIDAAKKISERDAIANPFEECIWTRVEVRPL